MKQYQVTGMSCAACSARVEKAVSQVEGVESCSVSLLTNSMGVEGTASPEAVIAAVEAAGYGASEKGTGQNSQTMSASAQEEMLKDKETPVLRRRLIASLCFLIPMMYVSTPAWPPARPALPPWGIPCGTGPCRRRWQRTMWPWG